MHLPIFQKKTIECANVISNNNNKTQRLNNKEGTDGNSCRTIVYYSTVKYYTKIIVIDVYGFRSYF